MTTIEHLWQGVSYLWNNANFADIDKTLQSTKDFHPTSALLYVTSPFSQFIENNGASSSPETAEGLAEIIRRADKAMEIAKKYDKNEWKLEDLKGNLTTLGLRMSYGFSSERNIEFKEEINFTLECATVYATALLYQSLADLAAKNYVKGNVHLRSSWKLFEKLLKEADRNRQHISDRIYYSIRFGVGMILTMIGSVPYKRLKALERAGFEGDMGRGLEHLFQVYEANALEAGIAALQIQLASVLLPTGVGNPEDHLAPVIKMSENLATAYPASVIFALNKAALYNKVGRYKDAILSVIDSLDKTQNSRLTGELAKSYMAYCNFQKASEFSEKAVKGGLSTITVLFLSAASWIAVARNTEYALRLLKGIQKPASLDQTGHHIYRRIKAINQGKGASVHFIPFEYLYYFRHIAHLALNEERAPQLQTIYDMLESSCASLADENAENQATFYTIKGALLKSMKKESDAILYFEKVVDMQPRLKNTEVHLPLFASEEMGEIRFAQKDYQKSEKHFKEVLKQVENRDVFFAETLQRRAYIALRQIKELTDAPTEKGGSFLRARKGSFPSYFTLIRKDSKEKEKDKEKEKEKKPKKSSLAERCALNRGTSFILTVEMKIAAQAEKTRAFSV